jgi:hypothetical protein
MSKFGLTIGLLFGRAATIADQARSFQHDINHCTWKQKLAKPPCPWCL